MGLPILLAAPKGEAAEIVEGHGAGRWLPPEAPEALADAVRALAGDTAVREAMAAAALKAAPGHSRETQAHEMLAVFEGAIKP